MRRPAFIVQAVLFGLSLLSIQGTIYLFQFAAASQMTAPDYSMVRLIESFAAIGALLVSFGIPSVALVKLAALESRRQTRQIVVTSLALVGSLALATFAAISAADAVGFLPSDLTGYGVWIALLSILASCRLLLIAIGQSHQDFKNLAKFALLGCASAVGFALLMLYLGASLSLAWLTSRLLLEFAVCAGLAFAIVNWLRGRVAEATPHDPEATISSSVKGIGTMALPVGATLLLRSLTDHGPLMWLAYHGTSAVTVAEVGFVLTLSMVSLVPTGIVQGVALPRLSQAYRDKKVTVLRGWLTFGAASLSAGSALLAVVLLVFAPQFIAWGDFSNTSTLVAGTVLVAAKALSNAYGAFLLVEYRATQVFSVNVATLAFGVLAAWVYQSSGGKWDLTSALWVICAIELVCAALYSASVFQPPVIR